MAYYDFTKNVHLNLSFATLKSEKGFRSMRRPFLALISFKEKIGPSLSS